MEAEILTGGRVICPLDGTPLRAEPAGPLRCVDGHSFDRAREGYYNLLAVQHKASRDPGDSREMVAARRRFLDTGHYRPIAEAVDNLALDMLGGDRSSRATVVDAGCGEGYYLDHLQRRLASVGRSALCAGYDISKWAVKAAARRNPQCFWAVASSRHMPFAAGSVDLVLSMFGFPLWPMFAAVQPPGGQVLLVDPASDHLIELRQIIYPQVNTTSLPSLDAAAAAGYEQTKEVHVTFVMRLPDRATIADLLQMTPHDHRATQAGREALARFDRLDVTADVVLRTLRRK